MRASTSSGSLRAAAGEDLDAVVGRRVVARGDHHAEVGVDVGDEERRGRGRDHAGVEHVDAARGEAGGDGGGDELTGDARVAGEDGDGALPGGSAGLSTSALPKHHCGGLGKAESEVCRQVGVRETANAVSTKQARHVSTVQDRGAISASRTEVPYGPS